jgi:hypothetical protein
LQIRTPAGRVYRNVGAVTVPIGTSTPTKVDAIFEAESAGAEYTDGPGTLNTAGLITPLPALEVKNEQPVFSPVAHNGGSLATITPSPTTSAQPNTHTTIKITIQSTGLVGAGSLVYELDSDAFTRRTVMPIPGTLNLLEKNNLNTGTTITLSDLVGTAPFVAGETYTFSTPASPITVAGRDKESNAAYLQRARSQWAGLSDVPTSDRFRLWVADASRINNYGITKITVSPSNSIAGWVDIVIAPAIAGAIAGTQAYVDARLGDVDRAVVRPAVNVGILSTGIVKVPAAQLAQAKQSAQADWEAYLVGLPLGGDKALGGVVIVDQLERILLNAGAKEVQSLVLAATPARSVVSGNVVLNIDDNASMSVPLTDVTSLTWVAI